MKILVTACSFLLLILSTLSSCKKDEASSPALIGEWKEMELGDVTRTLTFKKDQSFEFSVKYKDDIHTVVTGTYETKGNTLEVLALQIQTYQSDQTLVKESTSLQLYEDATFSISKDVLTLQYTTYPADAPMPTTAKFQRQDNP